MTKDLRPRTAFVEWSHYRNDLFEQFPNLTIIDEAN